MLFGWFPLNPRRTGGTVKPMDPYKTRLEKRPPIHRCEAPWKAPGKPPQPENPKPPCARIGRAPVPGHRLVPCHGRKAHESWPHLASSLEVKIYPPKKEAPSYVLLYVSSWLRKNNMYCFTRRTVLPGEQTNTTLIIGPEFRFSLSRRGANLSPQEKQAHCSKGHGI